MTNIFTATHPRGGAPYRAEARTPHEEAQHLLAEYQRKQRDAAREADRTIEQARIEAERGLKTIFVNRATDGTVANVYAAPDADSLDGLGEPIEEDDGKWETFGSADMPYAEIGFAVASPMLLPRPGATRLPAGPGRFPASAPRVDGTDRLDFLSIRIGARP